MVPNEKERGKGIRESMSRFDNSAFSKSNEKNNEKASVNRCYVLATPCFQNPTKRNNTLLESVSKERYRVLQTTQLFAKTTKLAHQV